MKESLPSINFGSIRPLRGKQADGFEELSVQLFYGETEGKGEFFAIEGSGGDGGVEAYRKGTDGAIVAVQSKYFNTLGSSQWCQITKSVKSALKNHSELRTYIVSTPLNRTPTQKTKWGTLVTEWKEHAKGLGITDHIDFVWWGYTELAGLLTKEEYRNQLIYWLGVPEFSKDWLTAINQSNIDLLGKRYSPKQHIKTQSGFQVDAFAWGEDGKERILSSFLKVSEILRKVERYDLAPAKAAPETSNLTAAFLGYLETIKSFRLPRSGYPLIRPLNKTCSDALEVYNNLEWELRKLNAIEKDKIAEEQGQKSNQQHGPYDSLLYDLRKLEETLVDLLRSTNICVNADDFKIIVLGEAGSGKSHLIADLITSAEARSQPALLLLGEQFLGNEDPWTAAINIMGWDHSADQLLAALDQEGILAGRPALLCIDALNESTHRRLWHSHLIQFAMRVSKYPHVKLLVSCRSDFVRITLPEKVHPGKESSWPSIEHQGYGTEVIEAIEVYFSEFDVRAPHFPPVLSEFRNPLFLRVFCEAFAGQELPSGPLGLDQVMRTRIDRLCTQIHKEIDCDPEDTRAALKAIAKEIAENGGLPILRNTARALTSKHFPRPDASTSLYGRLLSNGILVESVRYSRNSDEDQEVVVRFPFERFSDYFITLHILDGVQSVEHFKELFVERGRLAHLRNSWQYCDSHGIARALSILVPERLNLEFADAFPKSELREMVLEDFLESLAWRSSKSITKASKEILDEAQNTGLDILPTYIRLSTIPQHPFNSEFLGKQLLNLKLPERELEWTIPVSELFCWNDHSILEEFIDWSFRAPTHLIPDEQALLATRLLLWLCSTNQRALRKRSSLAAIRLLFDRPQVVRQLISEFKDVDDPYIVERLYAAAAGVAMRLPKGQALADLATDVHSAVFAHEFITPNILIRDYCSTVLEACLSKDCLPTSIACESFRPPFASNWPSVPTEEEVKCLEDDDSWWDIVRSLRCESMGNYGDFGRYVMDSEVRHFSDLPLNGPAPDSEYSSQFPGIIARRWILRRVEELGWTSDRFAEYEKRCPVGRHASDGEELKLERIGKKYQWIALREFTGFLCDHYWLDQSWKEKQEIYTGAWQLWAREFDPSQRLVDLGSEYSESHDQKVENPSSYPSPFNDVFLCNDRSAWVAHHPDDFAILLRHQNGTPDTQETWLNLAGFIEWMEPEYDRVISGRQGILKMWVSIRSFLLSKKDMAQFVSSASLKNFYGHGIKVPEAYSGWIGEFPWGRVYDELTEWCAKPDDRVGEVGVPYFISVCNWHGGSTYIPSPQLCEILDLEWAGEGGAFRTKDGEPVIDHLGGDSGEWGRSLLVRENAIQAALKAKGLSLAWCLVAERSCWCPETSNHITGTEQEISAVYWLDEGAIKGGQTQNILRNFSRH